MPGVTDAPNFDGMTDPYFSPLMQNRQVFSWAVATRLQLDRWEPLVAAYLRMMDENLDPPGTLIWQAEFEHHFCLIAARNLFRALDMFDPALGIDPTIRAELLEGRDLHEHWDQNMPVFNVRPRQQYPPRRSGKDFAQRNPNMGPYWCLTWDNITGPKLLPNVPASAVHALLDRAEARVLKGCPELAEFRLPRAESPWIEDPDRNGWYPRSMSSARQLSKADTDQPGAATP
jgi:hypothetical protein